MALLYVFAVHSHQAPLQEVFRGGVDLYASCGFITAATKYKWFETFLEVLPYCLGLGFGHPNIPTDTLHRSCRNSTIEY